MNPAKVLDRDFATVMPDHEHMAILLEYPLFSRALVRSAPPAGRSTTAAPVVGAIPAPRTPGAGEVRGMASAAPPTDIAAAAAASGILPVTTVQQALRIALDRTRRMTLLGSVPGVRRMVVPWLLPLHLMIVGLTADHIRHTPEASLSYSDGATPRAHRGALVLAVLLGLGWSSLLSASVWALSWWNLPTAATALLAVALVVPAVEFLSLVEFAALNPQWVMLKRARDRRTDHRTSYVLTTLVSTRDGCGAARRLMDLTYAQWRAVDAVVIGYPASKSLVSYYIRMGARRSRGPGPGRRRPTGRAVTFDCRRPLRTR